MRLDRKRARKLRRKQKDICTSEDENIYEIGGWMSRRRYRQIRGSREAYAARLLDRAEKPHRTARRNTRDIRHQRALEEQELEKRTAEYSRISRSRRRELMQDRKPMMQKLAEESPAAAAAVTVTMLPYTMADAAGMETMHTVPAAFQTMQNERNRIADYHAMIQDVRAAKENLRQAKEALNQAASDRQAAAHGLKEARASLEAAYAELSRVKVELSTAKTESARRTEIALESQRAVADLEPAIWNKETEVQEAQSQADYAQEQYDNAETTVTYSVRRNYDLENLVREAWESVDWQQNRIREVEEIVNAAKGTEQIVETVDDSAMQYWSDELDSASAALDARQSELDELVSQLDALRDAEIEAEDAEEEARERVRELDVDRKAAENDVAAERQGLYETQKWNIEAENNYYNASAEMRIAGKEYENAKHGLEHFGEDFSVNSSFEYSNWHGPWHGHQLSSTISIYRSTKKVDFGIDYGSVESRSGLPHGSLSGLLDTNVSIIAKNDHKKNDVHYEFQIGLPTGRTAHQNAQLPSWLAKYTSFGEGWKLGVGAAFTRHFSEEDSLTLRFGYLFRGSYRYRLTDDGQERRARVEPGNQLTPEIEWLHAGKHGQALFRSQLVHTERTYQDGYWYNDGNSFQLQGFYSHDMAPRISWQAWTGYGRDGRTDFQNPDWDSTFNDPVTWYGLGTGITVHVDRQRALHLMLGWQKANGDVYLFNTYSGSQSAGNYWQDPKRWSLTASYEWRLDDKDAMEFRVERYAISDHGDNSTHGWSGMLMYSKSL